MNKEELIELKNNEDIKFIYKIPCSYYVDKFEYIIIGLVSSSRKDNIRIFSVDDWFLQMKSGSILPYVCATLSKSGKIKEFINIYEKPDIINVRKYIIACKTFFDQMNNKIPELDVDLIQECLWGIQIIKEGKINRIDVFKEKIYNPFKEFIETVDPIYKMWKENNEQSK